MSVSSNVSVKAYLDKKGLTNGEVQIRRFDLDQEVSSSYEYLRSKLAAIFPDLVEHGFRVYWKDEENDMIAVSSDEELTQALLYGRPTGLLKLFIRVENSGQNTFAGPTGHEAEHPGVLCDGCDQGVRGLRFKCLVCPDYDLCSTCCDKGIHNHHYMLRLATPASDWTNCGRRQGRNAWGWPVFGAPQFGGAGFPGNMRKFWKQMMRGQREDNCAAGTGQDGGARCSRSAGEAPASEAPGAPSADKEKEEERDYLQHVGEQVSALLEPLGVSVDVDVEERGPDGVRIERRGHGKCRGQGRRQGGKDRQCARGGKCRPAADCKKSRAFGESGPSRCHFGETSGESGQSLGGEAASAEMTGKSEPKSMVDEDIDMENGEDASWIKIEEKPVSMDVLFDSASKFERAGSSNETEPQQVPAIKLYPSLTRSTESPSAPPLLNSTLEAPPSSEPKTDLDVKVAEAIEQMRTMGFHDDGGWMTAMLYENGGDVHKVIDKVLRTAQSVRKE